MEFTKNLEGFLAVPGGKVWYRSLGCAQPTTPLLVLHGGPGAPHDYLEPLELLTTPTWASLVR